jgi:hypothetical protein
MKFFILAFLFSMTLSAAVLEGTCSKNLLGGGEVFPWGTAEPFPWKSVQGVWRVHNDSDTLIQFRVTNSNKKERRLVVQVYSRENCAKPLYKVPGVISETEPNVMRMQIGDNLMKIAWFNTENLKMNPFQCGDFVMAASLIASSDTKTPGSKPGSEGSLPPEDDEDTTQNFFLKKISNSLEIYCKRRI